MDQAVWYECTVKLRDRDAPALTAWVGVGIIVYTEPIAASRIVPQSDEGKYRFVVAGYHIGHAESVNEAQAQALLYAKDAVDQNLTTYRNEREWFAGPVKMVERRRAGGRVL